MMAVNATQPETKHCWKCESVKAAEEFSSDKSRHDGLKPICKPCSKATRIAYLAANPDAQKKAWAKWYANPENAKKHSNATVQHRRERAHRLITQFKSAPCSDCKNSFPSECMDFDHRPGVEKRFELSFKYLSFKPLEDILDEIAKCDLVCANCHRIRTVARNQVGRK